MYSCRSGDEVYKEGLQLGLTISLKHWLLPVPVCSQGDSKLLDGKVSQKVKEARIEAHKGMIGI